MLEAVVGAAIALSAATGAVAAWRRWGDARPAAPPRPTGLDALVTVIEKQHVLLERTVDRTAVLAETMASMKFYAEQPDAAAGFDNARAANAALRGRNGAVAGAPLEPEVPDEEWPADAQ